MKANESLIHMPLREVLTNYLSADKSVKDIRKIIRRIERSGHSEMIKLLFTQFFIKEDEKKNTLLIKGVSNSGKTKFMEILMEIFPCE